MQGPQYLIWRPIMEKVVTLEEVRRSWDLCDVMDANDMLNHMAATQEANTPDPPSPKGPFR